MTKLQIDADDVQQALDAMLDFIAKVDSGRAKSVDSYAKFKAATEPLRAALQQPEQQNIRNEPFNHRTPMQPEPQAQAGEPEVVAKVVNMACIAGSEVKTPTLVLVKDVPNDVELITLQSHREAMAQATEDWADHVAGYNLTIAEKDEALKDCVGMLKELVAQNETSLFAAGVGSKSLQSARAAITKAQGAMK